MPAEQRKTHRETDTRTRQPATTTPSETPITTLHYLKKHGEEEPPVLTSRPTFASGRS
ncbi:hypothetical protein QR46_4981 [Giardia duodenalis assemblage B]|uniref:Uncharacterized protein n=1 Tax=Giardia duodenalis assemblage B TaxID=1394984 RepID=A0A132NLY4_GIAIN|nr:hypothetical protein QR46_4981 [Giardia intestinalis assemblage B]